MLNFESNKGVRFCDGLTRRDFLRAGSLSAGAVGVTLADLARLNAGPGTRDVNCILLFLVGGPSQLDTWDLKPSAPASVRGPFKPIQTNVAGVQVCEHFPRLARMADRFAIVRSVHHAEAPIHETGHQLMQTGRLFQGGREYPHYGAVLSHLKGPRQEGLPPFVVLPGPIGNTGVSVSHGQTAGFLGNSHQPVFVNGDPSRPTFRISDPETPHGVDPARLKNRKALRAAVDWAHRCYDADEENFASEPAERKGVQALFTRQAKEALDLTRENDDLRTRYGPNTFGQSCLLARRLVEHGVRLVTVNMFDTVFNEVTWDCHADGGSLAVRLDDYKETLCPMFDTAYAALLEDLTQRGMLDSTLVLATGEFGRTPQLNSGGGRDHWPGVWSVLFAGAGVKGGQVIGSSDRIASEPRDRPVSPAEVAATVYQALGLDPKTSLPGPENRPLPLADAAPIHELFRE
jgi:hypothetical protein